MPSHHWRPEVGYAALFLFQVIEFSLRPLYDPEIPLETFLSRDLATAFRNALKTVTEYEWDQTAQCNQLPFCASVGGVCIPNPDRTSKTVSYQCVTPGSLADDPPIQSLASDSTRGRQGRVPIAEGELPPILSMQFLQVIRTLHTYVHNLCWPS